MIWTNVLQRCTVLVPTMDSTKLLMIWGQGIMSYSVNGIPCVDCKFSTRLNDCGWLEWIVGLMVHFLICDDIYIGKFDRVFFYEVARLWRWCFSYMIIQFMAVGLPWIVDQYKWSARPSQYQDGPLLRPFMKRGPSFLRKLYHHNCVIITSKRRIYVVIPGIQG